MENIQLLVDSFWPMFKAGLLISVPLMLVSFVVGLVLAFVLALMRMSKIAPFKAIAWFVVWVIRGTPLLVQIYVIYFGLPSEGLVLDPIRYPGAGHQPGRLQFRSHPRRLGLHPQRTV